ncbi:hypothetical protein ACMXYQ_08945 [Neptuniibacter sp. PT34_22]|uniref:hypothetical protein n=1 Tax=Neptuniibacter sp. PT34_22 TaxID=3398205 RepID=UPI0039F4A514
MKLLANMVVPIAFLIASLFAYSVLSTSLRDGDSMQQELMQKLEQQITENPVKAQSEGLHLQLKAQTQLQESEELFLSALRSFLVEGAIALFMLSLAWQFYIHHKTNGNS